MTGSKTIFPEDEKRNEQNKLQAYTDPCPECGIPIAKGKLVRHMEAWHFAKTLKDAEEFLLGGD